MAVEREDDLDACSRAAAAPPDGDCIPSAAGRAEVAPAATAPCDNSSSLPEQEEPPATASPDSADVASAIGDLKLDVQWEAVKTQLKNNPFLLKAGHQNKNISLFAPESKSERTRSSPKHRKRHKRRKPYDGTMIPSFDKLSFGEDRCSHQECRCNVQDACRGSGMFNYAHSSGVYRPVLREARFSLHNQSKDKHSIIRAARLRLNGRPDSHGDSHGKRRQLRAVNSIFGSRSNHKITDFGGLVKSKTRDSADKGAASFSGNKFKVYRCSRALEAPNRPRVQFRTTVSAANSASVDRTAAPSSSGHSAGRRQAKRPSSCSQQARLDDIDMSVDELAGYFEDFVHIPKKMSTMAEMMYT